MHFRECHCQKTKKSVKKILQILRTSLRPKVLQSDRFIETIIFCSKFVPKIFNLWLFKVNFKTYRMEYSFKINKRTCTIIPDIRVHVEDEINVEGHKFHDIWSKKVRVSCWIWISRQNLQDTFVKKKCGKLID